MFRVSVVLLGAGALLVGGAVGHVPVVQQMLSRLQQLAPPRQHGQNQEKTKGLAENGTPTLHILCIPCSRHTRDAGSVSLFLCAGDLPSAEAR